MTNPDNAVGTNAAYGGRTSANAFNDDLSVYTRGILSGWACAPNSGLTVVLGGDGSTRDVAIAEDNAGNKTTINNISGTPVSVTISAAPGANSRIDAIVAYVDNPPQGSATIADNYEACGLISVTGTASSSPVAPSESTIRSAITADGASGATAYYVVLATIRVPSGTTDITASNITAGLNAMIQTRNLDLTILDDDYSTSEIDTGTIWIDGKKIYKKTISVGSLPNNSSKEIQHGVSNFSRLIKSEMFWYDTNDRGWYTNPRIDSSSTYILFVRSSATAIAVKALGTDWSARTNNCYVTIYYTKTS